MRWRTLAVTLILSLCAAVPLWAQAEPGEPTPPPEPPTEVPSDPIVPPPPPVDLQPPVLPQQPGQQMRQTGTDIRQVLANIAQRFSLQVVVDPLLQARVNPPTQANNAQAALEAVTRQVQGLTWRKVYLRSDMETPASETLVNWVRTAVNLEAQGLIISDATGNRITSFVRNVTVPAGFEQQLDQMSPAFKRRPIYVVFYQQPILTQGATRRQGQARAEDLLSLEQQRMQMFMNMSPEERQRAIRMGVQMLMNMDPSVRMQMMQEGMRMFMNMSPEERRMLMEQGMQMFQQMFQGGPPGPPPPAPGR